ncbi:MAG TPA: hypothetical protein VKJ07_05695, partial [Mycobacteriales bacterium]|nr:hypothetical protein [Mycobacteriales bacterium]
KTGTTENHADAWFIGYVPQLSTAVWVGYPNALVPMTDVHGIAVSGGTYPAQIFGRYMKPALANVAVQDIFTASPDDLSLHRLDDVPTLPTTTSSSPSSTSSTLAAPGPPPAVIEDPGSEPSPPSTDQPQQQYQPPPPPRTTPTTRPPATSTTQPTKKQATSQTTMGG